MGVDVGRLDCEGDKVGCELGTVDALGPFDVEGEELEIVVGESEPVGMFLCTVLDATEIEGDVLGCKLGKILEKEEESGSGADSGEGRGVGPRLGREEGLGVGVCVRRKRDEGGVGWDVARAVGGRIPRRRVG